MMGVDDIELETTRSALERGADEASKDLERFYGEILPEISEISLRDNYLHLSEPDHALATRLRALRELPEGTLGHAYVEFYRRNDITLPGDDIHFPAHYVNHDMNHVITGYEPTAPGEIARSGFLWAANDSRHNWLEFLITMSIHETGVLNHGDIRAKVATLDRGGVPNLFGEGLERGSQCTVDLTQLDHLALATLAAGRGAAAIQRCAAVTALRVTRDDRGYGPCRRRLIAGSTSSRYRVNRSRRNWP